MFSPSKLNDDHSNCMMVPPPVSQQFCLKWNDHSFNLVKTFSLMAYDQNFVDVTLACEGSSIKAHKVVLSACSNYFKELFLSNPCKHPIVILKDIKMDDLKAIVDFMYKGEINVFQHQLGALLKTAEILKVKGLTEVKDDDDDENKLNQEMREMDKENEPVNSELPRAVVADHATILTDNECHMNGVSSQTHYQSQPQQQQQPSAQPSQLPQPLTSHLAPQQHPIQQISSQQQPFTSSQPIAVSSTVQIQSQVINNVQPHISLNQQPQTQSTQQGSQQHQQPSPSPIQKQPTPTVTPTPQPSLQPIQSQQQNLTPPQSQQSPPPQTHISIKPEVDASQQIHSTQLATQQLPLPQQQHKQNLQPRKRRRRRSKRSVDSSSIEEGSGSEEASGSGSGDDDSVSGDSSISKRLKPPAPPSQGNSLDHSNHSLTSSRRRQPLALPPPPPPPVVSSAIQSHRELVNNSDYGHLDDSSETWQDGEQMSMNNPMGDASEESNGMIDIKPIVSFDEGSVGASMNNMSVSSENMIVAHMDYPSLSPGSTGSTPSNASNTGKICRCQHCGLTFTAYSSLRRHMQRHFADRERYVCDICLKSYSRKDYLKEHKKLKHPTT